MSEEALAEKPALSLNTLMRREPHARQENTFTLDMSTFFPVTAAEEGGKIEFKFRRLGVNQIMGSEETAQIIKRQRPEWSDTLCATVAGIVLCHLEPATDNGTRLETILFYCELFDCKEDDPLLVNFIAEFNINAGSNYMGGVQSAVQEAKKNLRRTRRPRK